MGIHRCQLQATNHCAGNLDLLGVASFPGPAQLFVACSTEKQGETGMFPHVSITYSTNGQQKSEVLHVVQTTTRSTLGVYDSHRQLARYIAQWY